MRVVQNVISNRFAVPCEVFDFVMVIPHAARHNHVLLHLDGAGRPRILRDIVNLKNNSWPFISVIYLSRNKSIIMAI